ncbi:MAG: ImpA family metalloprotease [Opitutaceae bacterium]
MINFTTLITLLTFILSMQCMGAFAPVQINFQPNASSTPSGYEKDAGEAFADRGNGYSYGWNIDLSSQTRDRGVNSDQRLDTLFVIKAPATDLWEIAIPNGNYLVTVMIGDPSYSETCAIDIEGSTLIPTTLLAANEYLEQSDYFQITDGRLSLSGADETGINFIHIRETPEAPEFTKPDWTLALIPGQAINSLIGRVSAFDHQGDTIQYSIVGSVPFSIDGSGDIQNTQLLDHNATQSYAFQVVASDGVNSSTVNVTAQFVQNAGVLLKRWTGISGSDVSDLTTDAHYQNDAPDFSDVINTLNVADAGQSNFGQKLDAVLVPSQTGAYRFALTSDDESQFRFALSGQPLDAELLAHLQGYTSYQNWSGAEESLLIQLEAGHAYPIEILHKEGGGGDHVSLGWKLDGAATYALIPDAELFQGYLTLEMTKPSFAAHDTDYVIAGATSVGATIVTLPATDSQGDPLTYAIVGTVPFSIDSNGTVTISSALPAGGAEYTFDVTVSDGTHTTVTTLTILTTSATAVEDAILSGSVDAVTAEELLDATCAEIIASQDLLIAVKRQLFNLNPDGSAKIDGTSLTDIDWDPTHDAGLLNSTFGMNTPVLTTNAVTDVTKTVRDDVIAIIGETPGRFMVFGSHPMRNAKRTPASVNADMHQFLENSLTWLTGRSDLKTSSFDVVIAHSSQSYYFPDEVATREWLDAHYPAMVSYNVADSADNGNLASALAATPDLLIISQVDGTDPSTIAATVKTAMEAGVPVLYFHHDGNFTSLGAELFSVFNVGYDGDNYWRRLQLVDYDITNVNLQSLPASVASIQTMLNHFKANDYAFDWNLADGENVSAVTDLQSTFLDGASEVRSIMQQMDQANMNVFAGTDFRLNKLLALLGDSYRKEVTFPMNKAETDDNVFLRSYFADHALYYSRPINPTQPDLGNFSRSDFSHITPVTKTVDLESKRNFRSAGVYALPGQTVQVTRLDSSDVGVKVYVNTQRSGSTHQWDGWGYSRPKYLQSAQLPIESGETILLTTPYGGPLQVAFDTNDLPVQLRFENVGEHPYWRGTQDDASFAQKMDAAEYDWAEIATPAFEVHSSLDKMNVSIANWSTPQLLSEATMRYLHNFPHILAGFQGPGIDVVAEIHDFATTNGWTINQLDLVKHMNADQATCGYGCSGNPYDAYWSFGPTDHGDLHELGHGLEVGRFRLTGWEGHSTTNPYSYYSKSQYYKDTGNDPDCQNLPFEYMFEQLQSSVAQVDPADWLQTNLWATSNWSHQVLMLIQMMMVAEHEGALEDGWNMYPRLHMLYREFGRSDDDDAVWLTKRDNLGFSTYTRTEARDTNNVDWMVIAISYVTGLDYRGFFEMYGYLPTAKADAQVASFGYNVAPQIFCLSTADGYGRGQGFNDMVLPVDGAQVWPSETDTDDDQQWNYFDSDDDNDLMPDIYEIANGFDSLDSSDATLNADNDAMDNRSEYIAGTAPRDSASYFRITQIIQAENGNMEIHWPSIADRLYSIWGTGDLSNDFTLLQSPTPSADGTDMYEDTRENISTFFYKVEIELP